MEENNYTEALRALHEALVELKAMGKGCEDKIQEINIILEKQGLKDWDAGSAVNKEYCEKIHEHLVASMDTGSSDLSKSVNGRIRATWAVLMFVLTGYGSLLFVILNEIF